MKNELLENTRVFEDSKGNRHIIPVSTIGDMDSEHTVSTTCPCQPAYMMETGLWLHNKPRR